MTLAPIRSLRDRRRVRASVAVQSRELFVTVCVVPNGSVIPFASGSQGGVHW